jgi:hypothetical protein
MEAVVAASGLAPAGDGLWVDARGHAAAVLTPAGAFVGWLDLEAGPCGVTRRLRAVEHVADRAALPGAVERARRARARSLAPCALCEAGALPGHGH